MAEENRVGRVSAIDYEAGTYEVTYTDRGKSVTKKIHAISNGEYKMPKVGQMVSVTHLSSGGGSATTMGTIWNQENRPAEGYQGLYRKEYGEEAGQAYERYDANTGMYTQVTDNGTSRISGGDISDRAEHTLQLAGKEIRLEAGERLTVTGDGWSMTLTGAGIELTCSGKLQVAAGGITLKGSQQTLTL